MSGRTRRRHTVRGAKHADPPTTPTNYWQPRVGASEFGREAFRVTAFRKDRPDLIIDGLVDQFSWQRQGTTPRTGTMDFYRPLGHDQADLIAQADQIGIDVSLTGQEGPWYRMLRFQVSNPQSSVVAGTTSLDLKTININQLTESKATWRYAKDRHRPQGWTARQITIDACKRFHAPVGRLPSTHTILHPVTGKASAYDIIIKAWKQERLHTGRRFLIDDEQGAVEVTEMGGRPRHILPMGPALAEAVLTSFAAGNYANSVLVHGKVKGGGTTKRGKPRRGKKPLSVAVVDGPAIDRYGFYQKTITAPGLHTPASLRDYGRKYLARVTKVTPTVELTHPGIPWVDVGNAIMLDIPQIRFHNLVYVTGVSHAVGAGQYTMDIHMAYQDPWLQDQSSKVSAAKRVRGLRSRSGSHFLNASARPRPAKSLVRAGRTHH